MAAPSFPTPLHGHVGRGPFSDVYEPAEDTFLLLDALEAAAAELTGCEQGEGPPRERAPAFWRGGGEGGPRQDGRCPPLPREEAEPAYSANVDPGAPGRPVSL